VLLQVGAQFGIPIKFHNHSTASLGPLDIKVCTGVLVDLSLFDKVNLPKAALKTASCD
jgi:hypothetical protein